MIKCYENLFHIPVSQRIICGTKSTINILRPGKMAAILADNTFKCIFSNENVRISINISLVFVPKGPFKYSSIDSDNGLAPTGHYLNQWWLVYWRIYASLSLNEKTYTAQCCYQSIFRKIFTSCQGNASGHWCLLWVQTLINISCLWIYIFTCIYIHISSHDTNLVLPRLHKATVNSLWSRDAIWHLRTGSTLDQVMACCLTAPNHYLNQCWLIIWGFVAFTLEQFHRECSRYLSSK